MRLAGATSVKHYRQATNGLNMNGNLDTVSTLIARCVADGVVPDYWLYQQGEAETIAGATAPPVTSVYNLPTANASGQYSTSVIAHIAHLVLAAFPNCRFVICTPPLNDFQNYGGAGQSAVGGPLVEAAFRALAADNPDRVLLLDARSPTKVRMAADSVHVATSSNPTANVLLAEAGCGYEQLAFRFRSLWSVAAADEVDPEDFSDPDEVLLHDDFGWIGKLHVPAAASAQTLTLATDLERIDRKSVV